MPTNKNTKLKSKSGLLGNKKRLTILLVAFSMVGAIALIRSFAATTVISFNPGDHLATNSISGFTHTGATQVSETVQDGKKSNTYNYVELSRTTAQYSSPSHIRFTTKLNEGFYQGCVTAKPVTDKAYAFLSAHYPSGAFGANTAALKENAPAGSTWLRSVPKGFSEQCINFAVSASNANKDFMIWFNVQGDNDNLPTNKWRVSGMSIKLNSREEVTPGFLIQAAAQSIQSAVQYPTFSGGAAFYDQLGDRTGSTQVNILNGGTGSIVKDSVNGVDRQVFQFNKNVRITQDTAFINSANNANGSTSEPDPVKTSNKVYQACYLLKSAAVGSQAQLNFYGKNAAGNYVNEGNVTVTGTGAYQTACIRRTGIKAGERLQFEFTSGATGWSVVDAWISELTVG